MDRYLRLLGIQERPSGLDGLRFIVRRHLAAVPFENISKLLLYAREGAGRPITLTEFLDGIEHLDLGGTCYMNNPFLADLLRHLGYDAELLGADMSRPNVHTCIRVRLGSTAYHVDVGFGSPFRDPIPLENLPATVREGGNRYVFELADEGRVRCTMQGEEPAPGYLAHDPPRTREFFDPIVRDSFARSSTFLNWLRIGRVFERQSVDLINRKLYRHVSDTTTVTELKNMAELKAAVANEFQMPRCPIDSAVAVLEEITGRPFFGTGAGA